MCKRCTAHRLLLSCAGLGVVLCGAIPPSGCTKPADHAVLEIVALNLAETDLDTIAVTYSVARDATGMELCEPYTVSYSLEHDGLPLRIEIRPGAEWRRSMFVRVEGLQAGVTRFRQERAASLTGGDVRVRVDIAPTCLDAGLGQGEHCVDGQVLESPLWRIFDQGQFVQIGEKCRDAP